MDSSTGTTTSSDATADSISIKNFDQAEWFQVVLCLNRPVRLVRNTIWTSQNERIPYIDNWDEIFSAMTNQQEEFESVTYSDASTFLSDKNPPTFIDFCEALLQIVPPLHNIHTLSKSHPRSTVTIESHSITTSLKRAILSTHKSLPNLKLVPLSNSKSDVSFDEGNGEDTQNLIFSLLHTHQISELSLETIPHH